MDIKLSDFNRIASKIPLIGNFKPFGNYAMEDLSLIGGTPMVLKYLLNNGLLNGKCMTCTGQTLEDNLKNAPDRPADQVISSTLKYLRLECHSAFRQTYCRTATTYCGHSRQSGT